MPGGELGNMIFRKWGGGSKAVWNFSENSSVWVGGGFPNRGECPGYRGSYFKHILLCTTSVAYDIIFLVSKEYPIAKVQVALVLQSHTILINCDQHLLHLIFKCSWKLAKEWSKRTDISGSPRLHNASLQNWIVDLWIFCRQCMPGLGRGGNFKSYELGVCST